MLIGLRGSLISRSYADHLLRVDYAGRLGEPSADAARTRFVRWWQARGSRLGPASGLRSIWDEAVVPLAEMLGFQAGLPSAVSCDVNAGLLSSADAAVSVVSGHWDGSLDGLWRVAVRTGISFETSWAMCTNGRALRLVDTSRPYSRAFLEFDLGATMEDPRSFGVLWGLLRAQSFVGRQDSPVLLAAVRSSSLHGERVGRQLRSGVVDALNTLLNGLASDPADLNSAFEESLTVVYRILFLLFAESRGLVPAWHPVYRDAYTIESLVDAAMKGRSRGLWQGFQAISRLAHEGCVAGSLVVPGFNGRLFSPDRSPMAESKSVDDRLATDALRALCTAGHHRIDYRDLGVEQLGTIYESVLDYAPGVVSASGQARFQLRPSSGQRKSSGSFYTPQSITDFIVRRALHPLVADATPAQILALRVLDPAMGSAAFLVSACRYLADAYERALIRLEGWREDDLSEDDRASFRRIVAQRCLYGVDINPTAVQLARLSLWLATLAAGKPLTFLDHHLACGDSIFGASPTDMLRQPPAERHTRGIGSTPLFSEIDLLEPLAHAILERGWMASTSDETVEVVREKETRLQQLEGNDWTALADLWCAFFAWPGPMPDARVFGSLVDDLIRKRTDLPRPISANLKSTADEISRSRRFFHWTLEFPEIFSDPQGHPRENGGFDAVIGNPPCEVLNAADAATKRFIRCSGVYRHQSPGHINLYQLFLERALQLVKRGGRLGLLVPAGFASDHHAARLRRRFLETTRIDTLTGFENRRGIFPIHRSVRFVICSATRGGTTTEIKCRFGVDDPRLLDSIPDGGDRHTHPEYEVVLTPALISAVGGQNLTIPELHRRADVELVDAIARRFRSLGDPEGWNLRFGRELNATDDRAHFHRHRHGLAVLEGKHIEPFTVHLDRAQTRISPEAAAALLDSRCRFKRMRLAYRDVASKTNKLSLIAALIPPEAVTTHSLFCLRSELSEAGQVFLCGVFNSYVANYLVRLVMTTHLGSTTVEQLRVPEMAQVESADEVVFLTRRLCRRHSDEELARLQALVARAYELTSRQFTHVLETFPLIAEVERRRAFEALIRLS